MPLAVTTLADEAALALRGLLPSGVAVRGVPVRGPQPPLWPAEAAAVAQAVPARQQEFAAGRAAARAAMAVLGIAPQPVPAGEDRAPVWPEGVVGSITHANGLALAAVARAGAVLAIGIDAEPDRPLPAGLEDEICGPGEQPWLDALDPAARARAGRRVFAAKEAIYKALYPRMRRVIGFHDLVVDGVGERVTARLAQSCPPYRTGHAVQARLAVAGGMILAASVLTVRDR
jgi:4'-phosphopantetheinyl transferase EntD